MEIPWLKLVAQVGPFLRTHGLVDIQGGLQVLAGDGPKKIFESDLSGIDPEGIVMLKIATNDKKISRRYEVVRWNQ